MVAPRWLTNRIQPIAVDDVVHYLAEAATLPPGTDRAFDVGGPEVMTYAQMMQRYAALTGLRRRLIVTLPVLTPGLASHWVGLVTPVGSGVAKPLVGSLVHDAVRREQDLDALVPPPPGGPTGFDEAVHRATATYDPLSWSRTLRRTSAGVAATAAVGSALTTPGTRWYAGLDKPAWQPPAAAFPVVWTALYAAIAVASAAALEELDGTARRSFARRLATNLALNAGWSGVFFRAREPLAGAGVAGALAASAADLTRRARPTGPGKAAAFGAYAGWCAFATALAAEIARRNR
jgi:tryptophan-rich sensory protein